MKCGITGKVCTFFGHSMFVNCRLNREVLKQTIKDCILNGFVYFYVGCHGEFDNMVLNVCCELKEKYDYIKIFVVLTSFGKNMLEKYSNSKEYKSIIFDIENIHYKRRIEFSNKCMADKSDLIICFYDEDIISGGTYKIFDYAKKQNKKIINLFNLKN